MRRILLALALLATPAFGQQPPFSPIADRDLWEAMTQALSNVPMALSAHQQVQQILKNVEQEASSRAVRKDAEQRATEQRAKQKEEAKPPP